MNNELYHYGVPGMKWGVKKAVYKQMSGQERRAAKKTYKQNLMKQKIEKHGKGGTIAREVVKRSAIGAGLGMAQLGLAHLGPQLVRVLPAGAAPAVVKGTMASIGALKIARIANLGAGAVNIAKTATSPYKKQPKRS